jgi:hypothetical protein
LEIFEEIVFFDEPDFRGIIDSPVERLTYIQP